MFEIQLKSKYIYPLLLQRSPLRSPALRHIRRIFNKLKLIQIYDRFIDRTIIKNIEQLRVQRIASDYSKSMEKQFLEVVEHLPSNSKSLMEIGPGLGGFSLLLARHFPNAMVTLVDKNGISEHNSIGFHANARDFAYYCEFNHVLDFMSLNEIETDRIHLVDITKDIFPRGSYDVICSFLAWGYHFPVGTYLNEVKKFISSHGCLIIDIREGTDGEQDLKVAFENVVCIERQSNFKRYKCDTVKNSG